MLDKYVLVLFTLKGHKMVTTFHFCMSNLKGQVNYALSYVFDTSSKHRIKKLQP